MAKHAVALSNLLPRGVALARTFLVAREGQETWFRCVGTGLAFETGRAAGPMPSMPPLLVYPLTQLLNVIYDIGA